MLSGKQWEPFQYEYSDKGMSLFLGCKGLGIQQGVHSDPISAPNSGFLTKFAQTLQCLQKI